MPKTQKTKTRIETTVHDEAHRSNIPTTELGSFLNDQDREPKPVLYPRDSSLDPQLVWKGKDEQDRHPLEVLAVPIYIQEKIHPKALIEALRTDKTEGEEQLNLWGDFNGIEFEELVEFYQHEQHWSNRMILGDSLLVMTSLVEKEGLKGKVQIIYMDPPYGIKFGSNWQVSTRKRGVKDGKTDDTTRQPEQIKAFRDTWELGIHSYLSYMRDRLTVARDLLTESGSIFVQIGDENVHLVRCLLDEIFGSENFISDIVFTKTITQTSTLLPSVFDHLLWYGKSRKNLKYRQLFLPKVAGEVGASRYEFVELADGTRRRLSLEEHENITNIPEGARIYTTGDLTSQEFQASTSVPFFYRGQKFLPSSDRHWNLSIEGMQKLALTNRIVVEGRNLRVVRYLDDNPAFPLTSLWTDTMGIQSRTDPRIYVVQTATKVIERCILMTTDPGDLVLDPTCGSGTTAICAEQWGRRWITIDTSRVALALARTRLMSAKFPYYLLSDSQEGTKKEAELSDLIPSLQKTSNDIKKGFVYKRVPHITLKSIAQNPNIHAGMTREEIDAAIARHAEQEVLVDHPFVDKKIVRVTGPFTFESLSPHITLPLSGSPSHNGRGEGAEGDDVERFQRIVLDHLRKAGVQNTVRSERLVFDSIEPWAGKFVHAVGMYNENGTEKRAAITIGPEYGTVDAELVRRVAREAVDFADLLIVRGFAFDGYIAGELRQLGKLPILKAAMNPDLTMGEELLKKTGSGNLFMVFGEPDIEVRVTSGEQWEVEVKGVDVYNPTTGEIRSHSTDDIACWFIDTSYDGNSFFVRHAYFCGGNKPYESLKRALCADIDEDAWSSLYRTTSRPFPSPQTGRIAVKVINHYGDEVMKVVEVTISRLA